jgi:ankyrin repeat protein
MKSALLPDSRRRCLALALTVGAAAIVSGLAPAYPALAQSAFDRVFAAVDANQPAELRALLAQGIDVNTTDRDGNTLLARAAQRGYRDVTTLLLASGARMESRNRFGETPLMYAALSGNEGIVRDLLARKARVGSDVPAWTALHYAALRGHAGVLAMLLDAGADINSASDNGTTALMLAASEGRREAVALLLRRGADAGRATDAGRTAGAWARTAGHTGIADMVEAAQRK